MKFAANRMTSNEHEQQATISADSILLEPPHFDFLKEPFRVTASHFGQIGIRIALCVLALLATPALARAQSRPSTGTAVVHGYVRDSTRRPVANAAVVLILGSLEQAMAPPTRITHTDSE